MKRLAVLAVAATVPLLTAAVCGDDDDASGGASPTPRAASPAATGAVTAAEADGHWSGDWGDLYLKTTGGVTRGVYPHDTGTVQGRISNGVFTGWWCEAPSRRPPSDAGAVEFTFIREADGKLRLDGRWKYANEGDWREDWDLELVDTPVDKATEARLANDAEFCSAP